MRGTIFRKAWRDHRRTLLWWGLGILALIVLHLLVYPSVRSQRDTFDQLLESYPEPLRALFGIEGIDYTSPVGYLQAELFGFMVPLIFTAFAVSQGARATAGEEEGHTIDLILSTPLRRRRVVLEKYAAALGMAAALAAVALVALWVGTTVGDMDVRVVRLAAALASLLLLTAVFAAVAMLLSCLTGRRGLAAGTTAALAVTAFLVHSLAALASWLEPVQPYSPFYLYAASEPLRSGLNFVHAAALIGMALVMLAAAVWAFERRDLAS